MKGKNLIKRVLSFVAAIAMTLGLMGASVVPAFAATGDETADYTITVTNQSTTTQTLSGNTFSAYKLFDVTYSGSSDTDPHAYTISTSNYFYTNSTAKGVLDQYFTFTASASDPTVMTVTVKSTAGPSGNGTYYDSTNKTLNEAGVRALADALQSSISGATATSTTTAGSGATEVVIDVTAGNHYTNASGTETAVNNGGPGYYIITGSVDATDEGAEEQKVIAAVGLTTTDPKRSIQVKADVPTLDKVITTTTHENSTISADDGITDTNGVSTTANVGDKISYKLTSVVPLMTDYTSYTFQIKDTLSSGLTFNSDSVKVYIYKANADDSSKFDNLTYGETVSLTSGQTAKAVYGSAGNDQAYTVSTATGDNSSTVVTINFNNFIRLLAYNGYTIEVTYDATLNNNALSTNAETNTAQLTYSNDPYTSGKGTTTEKKTYVYDFDLVIDKWTGADPSYTSLKDAKFVLYKRGAEQSSAPASGDYDTVKGSGGEADKYYPRVYYKQGANSVVTWATGKSSDSDVTVVTTDANGSAKFTGLEAGTYYLLETEAPNGYNKLTEATPVTVTASYVSTAGATKGQLDKFEATGGEVKADASFTNKAGTSITLTNKQNVVTQIENKAGSLLPSTGGIGTTIFYVIGGVLVAGAVVLLVLRRRKNA